MRGWTISALAVVAFALAGCETMSPQAVANADAQRNECNTVRLSSAAKQLRMDSVHGGYQADADDSMAETEGQLDLGRVKLNEPRALRNP